MIKSYFLLTCLFALLLISERCTQLSDAEKQDSETEVVVEEIVNELSPEAVEVMVLKKQEVNHSITCTSNLKAFEAIHLASSSPGRIEKIFVEIGDKVREGQIVVQMDRTQLHQAIIQLKTLETDLNRLDTLIKTNTISQQQYDQVKAQYDVAKSNVAFLEENTQLCAPIGGTITGKYYEDGEFYSGVPNTVAGKAAIVTIMQVNPLKAVVNISEQHFPDVRESLEADISCDIYPGQKFNGRVYRVHPVIDPLSRTFEVEISVPNTGEKLRPGMYARVDLFLGKSEALLVPAIAVLKLQGSNVKYVFLNDNRKARMVEVKIGKRFDELLEIISDELNEGDQLIVTGQSKLVDNAPVKITNSI